MLILCLKVNDVRNINAKFFTVGLYHELTLSAIFLHDIGEYFA